MSEPKFKVGDRVVYTNDYGVEWPDKRITEIEPEWQGRPAGWRYYCLEDTPWFSVPEASLRLDTSPPPPGQLVTPC